MNHWTKIEKLFPDLSDEQILEVIQMNKLKIRSMVAIEGETTMKFGYGSWKCDTCGKESGAYRTYCDGCNKKNITLP